MSESNLLIVRIWELIRKEFPKTPFTIKELEKKFIQVERIGQGEMGNQIWDRLNKLRKAGYIQGYKDKGNNNQWVYWLPGESDDSVYESAMKTILSEFLRMLTMYVDDTPYSIKDSMNMLTPGVNLEEFLTVSRENEFPMLDDELIKNVQSLYENYTNHRFTMVEVEGEIYPMYIFQVRMLSQGLFVAGLKPLNKAGAALKWIRLDHILKINSGDSFTIQENHIQFIKETLSTLSNRELEQLHE